MAQKFVGMAAHEAGGKLSALEFDPGPLGRGQVEIAVTHCGICHSDLSMVNNEWGMSAFPFVPGHEAIGRIVALGDEVPTDPARGGLAVGQTVGLGWFSGSCMACPQCLRGDHNLCASAESTMIGRYGGFATRVRCSWLWAIPLPSALDPAKFGPMFCGGITVFNPIVQFDVKPTDRVGVIGIGGLGHMALQFLNKWGCEVYAFSSNPAKKNEALSMGAHHVIDSRSDEALGAISGRLDFLLSTVNVNLNWPAMIGTLAPRGHLHFVGVVPEPVPVPIFPMILGQRSVAASPLGSPATTAKMLDFCARHGIAPVTEVFPMSKVNEALEHLGAGKARYRIVLENDLG
jgi:uncharacterized zinc-type alcohol dehydrogenase-like protein